MQSRRLPSFPNYDRAQPLDVITPDIGETAFVERYVSLHRACVIRGAAKHWPAIRKWNVAIMRSHLKDVPVGESFGLRYEPMPLYSLDILREMLSPLNAPITYGDFFDMVESRERPCVQLNSEPVGRLGALLDDLGDLTFLDIAKRPARFYYDRLFLSRGAYTDWHMHLMDETITVQVCGPKEILMLSPDASTYDAMFPICRRGVWQVPKFYWTKEFAALVPWRGVLEPGDAVYIPVNWWHALESLDDELNVTLAKVFATPLEWLGDLRLKNVRLSTQLSLLVGPILSASSRSVGPLADALRSTALTLAGFPLSLARNRRSAWRRASDHAS